MSLAGFGLKVWCDAIVAAVKGKTQDTFDSLGTITIKQGAAELLGIIACVTHEKITDGENGAPVLRVKSDDLELTSQDFVLNNTMTDGNATNNVEEPMESEFIPMFVKPGLDLGNARVDFSLSGTVTTTAGWNSAIGLVFANGKPDMDFKMELLAQQHGAIRGGKVTYARAGITTASETAFTTGISIPSTAEVLRALLSLFMSNAPAEDDPGTGYTKFTAPAIEDFEPQKWPYCISNSGILGTPADSTSFGRSRYYPTRFPLPKVNFTMDVAQKMATAQNAAGDGIAAMKYS